MKQLFHQRISSRKRLQNIINKLEKRQIMFLKLLNKTEREKSKAISKLYEVEHQIQNNKEDLKTSAKLF